ncbi:hypothetical protein OIN60_12125 [Paenibacillus sp. P96]|uniref:Uncharacterized protein n=1 Tax=Paenibacillus zeirhizosphaerae TaxID=2987519 RepID=A0ABT9FS00_9BACL|nr:hypothetical protein [Paenibacillus sp. P96]MDP4097518.1 hypothetical protein [Paenibacillus sp. P96]
MLFGSLRINLWSGVVGFTLTFLLSLNSNLLTTSLIRGLIASAVWFLFAFAVRFVLGMLTQPEKPVSADPRVDRHAGQGEGLGSRLDLTTPDESEELNDLLNPMPDSEQLKSADFKPLDPPKLVTSKDPEELAKAVRHLTDK